MFREAHGIIINGGNFQNRPTYNQSGPSGIDILFDASTPEAAVDAEERAYAPSCFPGTREQYIADITNWAKADSGDQGPSLYWMKGPAGVGKSAIAQTCAERLKTTGDLGAAFFFSVNGRRKDHTRFVPTLAYQLSTVLPNYRKIVNRKVSIDRTLVRKTMSSQFKYLIAEPLHELRAQGKDIPKRAIIIDGLDECESKSAQVEIIQIIASSIQPGTAPFRWAIFSREEPHILATFSTPDVSSHCYSAFLPISRQADKEIELYLRGGFNNILRRRNFLRLSSSWPTAEQIEKLVNAAAGLFAHPATLLRFIDHHSYAGFKETLEIVLASITNPSHEAVSPFDELDELYILILQRVPEDIFPSMQLILSSMVRGPYFNAQMWDNAVICNSLGISETVFRAICDHLHAVVFFGQSMPLHFDETINLERSYFDQDQTFELPSSLVNQILHVHGYVCFYHKSFYDFLLDPARSSNFCVTSLAIRENSITLYVQQQRYYALSCIIQGSVLVSAPDAPRSSASLSWPQGSEFVDSYLKFQALLDVSYFLSHHHPHFGLLLEGVSPTVLQKLGELDYRKSLLADSTHFAPIGRVGFSMFGRPGIAQVLPHTTFRCFNPKEFGAFKITVFLATVEKLERAQVIRPYRPPSGLTFPVSPPGSSRYGRCFGQYTFGRGDKSIVWYWEFDEEKQYFHEFRTMNFAEAMEIYRTEKFRMWGDLWVPPS